MNKLEGNEAIMLYPSCGITSQDIDCKTRQDKIAFMKGNSWVLPEKQQTLIATFCFCVTRSQQAETSLQAARQNSILV